MEHTHTSKVLEWGLDAMSNFKPKVYGCTDCDETFTTAPSAGNLETPHEHSTYTEGCFRCKIMTLELSTGDANGELVGNGWTNKKWNNELSLYREARSQGIQPDGTSTAQIRQAMDVSDKTGYAYGSDL